MSVKAILTEQQKSYTKAEEDALLATKQNTLTFDTTPTSGSTNPATSDGIATALDSKANLDTPTFIGVPKAPTAAAGTNTTQIATTAFVEQAKNTRVPVYGFGKNLLDNWYFGNPVNQRNESTYDGSGAGYTIDRWRRINSITMTLQTGYIQISNTNWGIRQDGIEVVPGQYTLTVVGRKLTSSGNTAWGLSLGTSASYEQTSTEALSGNDWVGYSKTITVNTTGTLDFYCSFNSNSGYGPYSLDILAFKVERGTEQTLYHYENDVLVLNEIPDYEEELVRCQISPADSTDTYSNKTLANEQELAYVENGTTASRNYAIGKYFCWKGLLYRAKTSISSGGTFTPGTNCELKSEGGLNSLSNQIIVQRQVLTNSITTGLNILQVEPTAIAGYKAIGVAGVQFASVDRTKINLVEFLIDGGTYVTVQFNSTYDKTGISVAAFVIYAKE